MIFKLMSIEYRQTARSRMNDGFSDVLREAAEFFANKGIQMTSHQGMEEILSEQTLFNEYKDHLLEGMEPDQVENFNQLMDNARTSMLQEASVSGVQQIAGLSMPTIRKMWAKVALKHAIPTQVVATPRFAISYTKAYLMDAEGNKKELPDAINNLNNREAQLPRFVNPADGLVLPMIDFDLYANGFPQVPALKGTDTIDKVFYVETVKVNKAAVQAAAQAAEQAAAGSMNGYAGGDIDEMTIRVHIKTDLNALISARVAIPVQLTDPTTGVVTKYGEVYETLLGRVDYADGKFTLMSSGNMITHAFIDARLSQEANDYGQSVSFDVLTKDVTIGVGSHLNAPLPIEWLQDTMAIYNIDGAAEVVDLMSQTVAQQLEIEIYNFLNNSIEVNNIQYLGEFNMIPSAGYNGTPKSWREELKTVIDYYAIKMKSDAKFHGGKFMIIGNPIDMQIIPNVDWVFNHTSDQMSGVDVSFNLGAFSGANKYEMVSSDLVPAGAFIMFFVPGIDRLMTYKYYPYTFNVERGYRDPNMPNVPSLMMTKRHALEEFTPLICRITIKNNIGAVNKYSGFMQKCISNLKELLEKLLPISILRNKVQRLSVA